MLSFDVEVVWVTGVLLLRELDVAVDVWRPVLVSFLDYCACYLWVKVLHLLDDLFLCEGT